MERVLDVYRQPYKAKFPVVCMDESPKQLIKETRLPIASSPGSLAKYDYEYERCGVCNIFLASEPLAARRIVKIRARKTKKDWANLLRLLPMNIQMPKRLQIGRASCRERV